MITGPIKKIKVNINILIKSECESLINLDLF